MKSERNIQRRTPRVTPALTRVGNAARRRWLVRAVVAMVAAGSSALLIGASAATAAPASAKSFYVTSYDMTWAYDRGCALGDKDEGLAGAQTHYIVLDFGATSYDSATGLWYVNAFGTRFRLVNARHMVEEFGHGYYVCSGADVSSVVYIGLGTNNSAGTVTSGAGAKLAQTVIDAKATIDSSGWSSQVHAMGANDIESWGSASAAVSWATGYNSVSGAQFYVNYGDASGCPQSAIPTATQCDLGAENIYKFSWGLTTAWPLPEIYTTTGSQAKQWRWLSRYSKSAHGSEFSFTKGVMAQEGACSQLGGCTGVNNSPSTAWDQLHNELVADTVLTNDTVGGPTDIWWK